MDNENLTIIGVFRKIGVDAGLTERESIRLESFIRRLLWVQSHWKKLLAALVLLVLSGPAMMESGLLGVLVRAVL